MNRERLLPRGWTLVVTVLLGGACDETTRAEERAREAAQSRAEELLSAIRNSDWATAGRFVYLDANTRARMGIADGVTRQEAAPKIEAWFRAIYGTVRPGSVHSVAIDPNDPTRTRVSYRHDDLDAFTMRLVNGEWFYVVD